MILHPSSAPLTAELLHYETVSEEPGVSAPSLHPKEKRTKDKPDTRGQSFISCGTKQCESEINFKRDAVLMGAAEKDDSTASDKKSGGKEE